MENVICDLCTGAHLPVDCQRAVSTLTYRTRFVVDEAPVVTEPWSLARLHDAITGQAPAALHDLQRTSAGDGVVVPILRHRNVAETGGLVRPKRRLA